MKVSIIVPVYNTEKYLDECISSVLAQTFLDWELILVNDGSTDSSGDICRRYAGNDNRIIIINQVNSGVSHAWYNGVNSAVGEYIIGLDSDDFWDNNLLEKCMSEVVEHDCDMVVFGYRNYDGRDNIENKLGVHDGLYINEKLKIIYDSMINRGSVYMRSSLYLSRINKLVRRSIVISNIEYCVAGYYYGEDNLYAIPNILDSKSIAVIQDFFPYSYRMNLTSITHRYHENLFNQFLSLNEFSIEILVKKGHDELIPQVMADCVFHAILSINNAMRSEKTKREKIADISLILHNKMVSRGCKYMKMKYMSLNEWVTVVLIKMKMKRLIYLFKNKN